MNKPDFVATNPVSEHQPFFDFMDLIEQEAADYEIFDPTIGEMLTEKDDAMMCECKRAHMSVGNWFCIGTCNECAEEQWKDM